MGLDYWPWRRLLWCLFVFWLLISCQETKKSFPWIIDIVLVDVLRGCWWHSFLTDVTVKMSSELYQLRISPREPRSICVCVFPSTQSSQPNIHQVRSTNLSGLLHPLFLQRDDDICLFQVMILPMSSGIRRYHDFVLIVNRARRQWEKWSWKVWWALVTSLENSPRHLEVEGSRIWQPDWDPLQLVVVRSWKWLLQAKALVYICEGNCMDGSYIRISQWGKEAPQYMTKWVHLLISLLLILFPKSLLHVLFKQMNSRLKSI